MATGPRTHYDLTPEKKGWLHLPIVPNLSRPCLQPEEEFARDAEHLKPESYAILLPMRCCSCMAVSLLVGEAAGQIDSPAACRAVTSRGHGESAR